MSQRFLPFCRVILFFSSLFSCLSLMHRYSFFLSFFLSVYGQTDSSPLSLHLLLNFKRISYVKVARSTVIVHTKARECSHLYTILYYYLCQSVVRHSIPQRQQQQLRTQVACGVGHFGKHIARKTKTIYPDFEVI